MNNTKGTFINFFAGLSSVNDIPANRMQAVLVNVPEVSKYSTSAENTKRLIKKTGARCVMLDSGGYTIFNTYRKKGNIRLEGSKVLISGKRERMVISPHNIIEAALKIMPDIVVGLDYPVIKTQDPIIQEEEFHKKKGINLQWMEETSELHQIHCPHTELYLPIQCYNLDQFADLEDKLMRLNFDSLALPVRNMTPSKISKFLIRIHELGIKKVHLLGTSSFKNIALATYFARNFFERCSVDSTTWRNKAQYFDYVHEKTLLGINLNRACTADRGKKLSCRCHLCRGITYNHIMNLSVNDRRAYLRRHNYLAIKKAGEEFFRHASNPNAFERYLRKRAPQRGKDIDMVMRAIRMADSRKIIFRKKQKQKAA